MGRTEVMAKLSKAHAEYISLKHLLAFACTQCDLPEDTLDAKLDIGHLSNQENPNLFDPEKIASFDSPNVMFDERAKQINFIDFDMNDWNEKKEQVFQWMMHHSFPRERNATTLAGQNSVEPIYRVA